MKQRYCFPLIKYSLYILLLCLSYVVSSSPGLSFKPILVLPMVVCIAIYEGEFVGGLYGALAGVLLDYGAMTLFGINAMLLLVLGCAAGLISLYLLRSSVLSSLILTGAVALIQGLVSFFLLYGIWRLSGASMLLWRRFLPTALLTVITAPLYHYGVGRIHRHFEALQNPTGETP